MNDGPSPAPATEKRARGGELVIPAAAVVFSLYYFSTILDSPWTAQVSAFFIGSVLIALSLAFMVRTWFEVRRGEADFRFTSLFGRIDLSSGRLALGAVTLAYIVLIEWGGFTITTFFFLFFSMLLLNRGRRKGLVAALSATMALGGYALFILAFDTRFPKGPFENFMETVLNNGG
jgi:hypothetical protein